MKRLRIIIGTLRQLGLVGLMKSLCFNIRYLGWSIGLDIPIYIYKNVMIHNAKCLVMISDRRTGNIKIGVPIVGCYQTNRTEIQLSDDAELYFGSGVKLGSGCRVSVNPKSNLRFGDSVCITANTTIICKRSISIGDGCLVSWNVQIMDTDFHKLYEDGVHSNNDKPIEFGQKVWINSNCLILKGSQVSDGCVIGAGSILNRKYETKNALIVGNPAHICKENIKWVD